MDLRLLTIEVRLEQDVVLARQRARQIAAHLGFDGQEQTRIATAVSEIVRNAFKYAGPAKVEFLVRHESGLPTFCVRVEDRGPGIAELDAVLEGRYQSPTGMGLGILGAKRLMDLFLIQDRPGGGVSITLGKHFAPGMQTPDAASLRQLVTELGRGNERSPVEEVQRQNQELLQTLEELRASQAELLHVNRELEDTNRGVMALLAELDEKADLLKRTSEIKSRFLSNMSHEFRTPLNTIISFTQLLLDRLDGPLQPEQEKQVRFIRKAADDLYELVNDVLDLAKVEAGKVTLRPSDFEVGQLFAALRGMLRPLLATSSLQLVFEEPEAPIQMFTDESKLSQVLRNFISNGIKFTERGEVRVSARRVGERVIFSVRDTGIGIAPEDQAKIFEEFSQIESPVQRRVKGTGLGLPLSKRLAELLGGRLWVESDLGIGSNFVVEIPARYEGPSTAPLTREGGRNLDPLRVPVLVVEDNPETLFVYEKFFKNSGFQALPARSIAEARQEIRTLRPAAIILDILLGGENTWSFLAELKSAAATKDIPVIVSTVVDSERKARALGADAYATKPLDRAWLLEHLRRLIPSATQQTLLVVDDDEATRYYLRGIFADTKYRVIEADGGLQALELARNEVPDVIILDLRMPDLNGRVVLERLKQDPKTAAIPVIIMTGGLLDDAERRLLREGAVAILSKESPNRDVALQRLRDALERAAAFRRSGSTGPVP